MRLYDIIWAADLMELSCHTLPGGGDQIQQEEKPTAPEGEDWRDVEG